MNSSACPRQHPVRFGRQRRREEKQHSKLIKWGNENWTHSVATFRDPVSREDSGPFFPSSVEILAVFRLVIPIFFLRGSSIRHREAMEITTNHWRAARSTITSSQRSEFRKPWKNERNWRFSTSTKLRSVPAESKDEESKLKIGYGVRNKRVRIIGKNRKGGTETRIAKRKNTSIHHAL